MLLFSQTWIHKSLSLPVVAFLISANQGNTLSIDHATKKSINAECPTAAAGIHRTGVADTAHRVSRITSETQAAQ